MHTLFDLAVHLNSNTDYTVRFAKDVDFVFETLPSLDNVDSAYDLVKEVNVWANKSRPKVPLDSLYIEAPDKTLLSFSTTTVDELTTVLKPTKKKDGEQEDYTPNPLGSLVSSQEETITHFAVCHNEDNRVLVRRTIFRLDGFVPGWSITIDVPAGDSPLSPYLEHEALQIAAGVLMSLCKPSHFFASRFNPGTSLHIGQMSNGILLHRDYYCEEWGNVKISLSEKTNKEDDPITVLSFSEDFSSPSLMQFVLIDLAKKLRLAISAFLKNSSISLSDFQRLCKTPSL